MKRFRKPLVLLLAILTTGAIRLPVEGGLTQDLRERRLLLSGLDLDTRAKLGQTSASVALGGLRTLVATFLNLRAYTAFENQDWFRVSETFDTITTLAPRTVYYWDTGAWHMATNAASYYKEQTDLPAPRRAELRRQFIRGGREFLEEGIRNNPESWVLPYRLAALYEDPDKMPDLDAAAHWMDVAVSREGVPDHAERARLYLLARHPDRQREALELARQLYDAPQHRVPAMLTNLFALERQFDVPPSRRHEIDDLFPTRPSAYRSLRIQWQRRDQGAPVSGIKDALIFLENELDLPPEERLFGPAR